MCVLILKDNLWFKAIEENSNECTIQKLIKFSTKKENKKWEIIEKILGEYRKIFWYLYSNLIIMIQ